MTTIALAEDHHLVRQGFKLVLSAEADFKLVGEAADGMEAVQLVERTLPNVLLLDLMIPRLHGLEVARQVGLEKLEAEFIGGQETAMKMFGLLGFQPLYRLCDYVKDMQAISHDYVLMGLDLKTDEEYAGMA